MQWFQLYTIRWAAGALSPNLKPMYGGAHVASKPVAAAAAPESCRSPEPRATAYPAYVCFIACIKTVRFF
jgi:hypothetical protein